MKSPSPRRQQGTATLVVVMVLFLIMAMMAAYGSRNLIFEQKIAGNYFRAGVSQEAAEAGVEWAIALLNGVKIDANCQVSAVGANSFRERYLNINAGDRTVVAPVIYKNRVADCVRNEAAGWTCRCPMGNPPALPTQVALNDAQNLQPRFALSFTSATPGPLPATVPRPGIIRLISEGCSSSGSAECIESDNFAVQASVGVSLVTVDLALLSALKNPPATPLTLTGAMSLGASGIGLHNAAPRSNGLLLSSALGSSQTSGLDETRLESLPGTPGRQALIFDDPSLKNPDGTAKDGEALFRMFFGMSRASYREQAALRRIGCPAGDCGPTLQQAYDAGARMAWIDGPLTINSNVTLGADTSPMLIVADGAVQLNGPMRLTGLLFANGNLDWSNGSAMPAQLKGAMLVAGALSTSGVIDLWYEGKVMDELSNRTGSFVRVPGSWFDSP
ncbi:PilX N-terminal domain-containing pilus assembly protein [Paucibacter sp. KBW04]|uniref:pilus assembly PilX family protein n=1 Tax=Paucibacter sp. KBW04 TaxID=2153361 RepID=UPI000F58E4B5|nr:PilX N-terminal domain-containing pilus assembly protein [Paucibacter sp. KBW04]